MIIKSIKLKNYRNAEPTYLSFGEKTTVFNGENAQGKTNILEALYIPVIGKPFRTNHDIEIIKKDCDFCDVEAVWNDGKRDKTVSFRYIRNGSNAARYVTVNKVPITKISELFSSFKAVLFWPRDLSIVKDGPSERRRFIDMAISHTSGKYLKSLQTYNNVLSQRNALLKDLRTEKPSGVLERLEPWSILLSKEAEIISAMRYDYVKELNAAVNETVNGMTNGKERVEISYHQPKSKEEYFKAFTDNVAAELKAGTTISGIHHDDLSVTLGGDDARAFCSEGQQRTIAIALKTAEGLLIKEKTGDDPVYLFDDILSELDDSRRAFLLEGIRDKQVFITSCDKITTTADVFYVKNGRYTRV